MPQTEEYYLKLQLPPTPAGFQKYQESEKEQNLRDIINRISNKQNREKLKEAFNKVVMSWSERHDELLEALEDSKKKLLESRRQSLGNTSAKSSCASSIRNSISFIDEMMDPILFDHQLMDSDHEDHDVCSLDDLPISPTPLALPKSVKRTEELTFSGNSNFWNTIANGKSNKAQVDQLISDYLCQGGNPNIAKSSESVKNVKEGYSLIHALIAIKNTAGLQKVIDAGAKTNVYPLTSKREDQVTPLVLAARLGYMNGVRLLIDRGGCDIYQAKGPYGENVLHAAVQSESDELVGYLLGICNNKLLDKTDNNGATPLHYACITGRTRLITLFVRDCHTQPDPKDNKGETPLHYAVRNRKLKVVAKLVGELGIDPNSSSHQAPTPLDLAKSAGLVSISEYLIRVGAKTTKQI